MANGRFVGDPEVLLPKGNNMKGYSTEFTNEITSVYNTLDNMVASEYISPEAKGIKEEIETYKVDLENMAKVINQYGDYCVGAANKIINNQDGIIDSVKGSNND